MIISPNDYLYGVDGKYRWSPQASAQAWKWARAALKDVAFWMNVEEFVVVCGAPSSGKSTWVRNNRKQGVVYFDACFDMPWKRQDIARFIRSHAPESATIGLVWINTSPDLCRARNNANLDRTTPPEVMSKMIRNFTADRPRQEAGFDSFLMVRTQ